VTYTVVIDAENPLGRLLPGMTATVSIVTGEHKDVVTVPNEALRYQPRGPAQAALVRDGLSTGVVALGERGSGLLARLKSELELTPEELEKISTALQAEFVAIKNAGPPGTGANQDEAREQARMRIAKVLRTVLSPEKYKKYEDMARQRPSGPHRVTLWAYENGTLVPREVKLGLADGNATEVVEGLPEGANVVLRVREGTP